MSPKLSRAVRKAFSLLSRHKKIYRDDYVVNRSVGTQSVVSDVEVNYHEEEGKLYYIRYFVEGKKTNVILATTRPETMFADTGVAVHPKDKRYKKLIGKKLIIPIINRAIPIVGDERVDPEFGTGVVKLTPTHDPLDFAIAKDHNLEMHRYAFDENGYFTSEAGDLFEGKKADDFVDNIINYLQDISNLEKIETHTHSVPYCDRTNTRIQPMLSQQRFVDVQDAAIETLDWIDNGHITVYPDRFHQTFHHWLDNIKPRCISRQLRRGHRIPVRHGEDEFGNKKQRVRDEESIIDHHQKSNETKPVVLSMILFNLIADSRLEYTFDSEIFLDTMLEPNFPDPSQRIIDSYLSSYLLKFADQPQLLAQVQDLIELFTPIDGDLTTDNVEALIDTLADSYLISHTKTQFTLQLSILADGHPVVQDEDVLDTWFSSALWPFSILGWPENTPDFNDFYPTTVLETGYDIIFFWVARMTMMAHECLQNESRAKTQQTLPIEKVIPFENVYLHGLIKDEKGQKMSKSKGNGIDPVQIINEYGADPLRLALMIGSTPGTDTNFSTQKIDYYRRFLNKLRNATRFIVTKITAEPTDKSASQTDIVWDFELLKTQLEQNADQLNHFDNWILNKLNDVIEEANNSFTKYQIGELGNTLISFVRHYFCDRYIEISKVEQTTMTPTVFAYAISVILRLLHPYAPFVTEQLWETLEFTTKGQKASLSINPRPTTIKIPDRDYKINLLMDIITELRNLRNQAGCQHHEKAHCYIRAAKNFIDFTKPYENLIKTLVKMESVIYLLENEEPEDEFHSAVIINISVGVKGIKSIDKKELLAQLCDQLEKEQQFLQSMREILSNPGFRAKAPDNVIAEKEQKMNDVKDTITKLEYEISKLKMQS